VRVLVREGAIDEETGEATTELVVIQGNAGATEEEMAMLAEEDDDGQCEWSGAPAPTTQRHSESRGRIERFEGR